MPKVPKLQQEVLESCRWEEAHLQGLVLALPAGMQHIRGIRVAVLGLMEGQGEVVGRAEEAAACHAEAVAEDGPGAGHVESGGDHRTPPEGQQQADCLAQRLAIGL